MSSSARKFMYPIPTNGVIQHEHPRLVGLQGLVDGANWLYTEGEFRTRGGIGLIGMEGVAGYNLLREGLSDAELTDSEDAWAAFGLSHTVTRTASYHRFNDYCFRIDWSKESGYGEPPNFGGVATILSEMPVTGGTTYNFSFYFLPPSHIINDTFWIREFDQSQVYVKETEITGMYGVYDPEEILQVWFRKETVITTDPTTRFLQFRIKHSYEQTILMQLIDGLQLSLGATLYDWEVGVADIADTTLGHRPLGFYQLDFYEGANRDTNILYLATDKSLFEFAQGEGNFQLRGNWPGGATINPENQVVFRGYDLSGSTKILAVNGYPGVGLMYAWPGESFTRMMTGGPLTLYPERARAMAIAGDRVLLGNAQMAKVDGDPGLGQIYWDGVFYSQSVLQGGFTADDAWSDAQLIRLADTPGEIVAMQEMGSLMVAVYKTDAIYVLTVQSGLYPFRPELRSAGISGPASTLSVVALNDNLHVYLARNAGLYIFDGSAPRSLGNHIQDFLRKKIDINMIERSFLFFDRRREELWVFYPSIGSSGVQHRAIMVSMTREGFPMWPMEWDRSKFDFTAGISGLVERDVTLGQLAGTTLGEMTGTSLGSFAQVGPFLILGASDGRITAMQDHMSDGGDPIYAFFETGSTDLEEPSKLKTIIEEQHLVDSIGADVCTVSLKFADYGAGNDGSGESKSFQAVRGTGPYTTEHRVTGREFSHVFEVEATDRNTYSGSIVAYRMRGAR